MTSETREKNADAQKAKPRERLFQVVPVPAVFTRGRWECIDYKDTGTTAWPCTLAIDNKIEQAMDLVKTHLTFAVREEVEVLHSTIADMEGRVALLGAENQILRQFVPAEIIANLPALVQQQQKAAVGTPTAPLKSIQTVPSAPVIMDQYQQQTHQAQQQQQHTTTSPPSQLCADE